MYSEAIYNQGFVNNNGGIIYKPNGNRTGYVKNIKFNNTTATAWIISLYRGNLKGERTLLYSLTLEEGDMINDLQEYHIRAGDYLYAISDLADSVSYFISGNEVSNDASK